MNSLMTKKEAADFLKISERKLDYLRQEGKLACIKIGNCVRFLFEDIEAYLQSLQAVPVSVKKKNP